MPNHDCKEFIDTIWFWCWETYQFEPEKDICSECGALIHEYSRQTETQVK